MSTSSPGFSDHLDTVLLPLFLQLASLRAWEVDRVHSFDRIYARDVALGTERLPGMDEALGSIPSTTNKNHLVHMSTLNPPHITCDTPYLHHPPFFGPLQMAALENLQRPGPLAFSVLPQSQEASGSLPCFLPFPANPVTEKENKAPCTHCCRIIGILTQLAAATAAKGTHRATKGGALCWRQGIMEVTQVLAKVG